MDKSTFSKCRLCLKLGDFCSIFELDESIRLSDMVMSFANIRIYDGDGLPDRVCNSCIENLSTAYLFKLQCEKVDNIIRKQCDSDATFHTATDLNGVISTDIHVHTEQGDNDENNLKTNDSSNDTYHEISDETDSDIESIKCVYCNTLGAHRCHVTCTVENEHFQSASSIETLVAADTENAPLNPFIPNSKKERAKVSCVLCDNNYEDYEAYILHVNKCTTNVKLHHYVCPVCHEIFTDKILYFGHLKVQHFQVREVTVPEPVGVDCVDTFYPKVEKIRQPTSVRRQIGWSIEDIYQEIQCKPIENEVQSASNMKNFLNKERENESFSRQSTPKRVSFRKLIEDGKTKMTATYSPFKNFIQSYKHKKKLDGYSPIKSKLQVTSQIKATLPRMTEIISDSEGYGSPSGTSEESWKMKQNLICACDKKIFMLSEFLNDRERVITMIVEMGGVVAENTKMEMLSTHFISVLPKDTFTGMMVCALATGKWLLHVNYVYDSYRGKRFLPEANYEWKKHPKILEIDNTSREVAKAAVYWHHELGALNAKFPFEGKQIVLIMKKKYRQYYQMIFKALKAKPVTYDPRTPGSCCSADYCFVDMKVIERVKLKFFARHNVPVFPYQYILVHLLNRGDVMEEHKYLLQDCNDTTYFSTLECFNNTL